MVAKARVAAITIITMAMIPVTLPEPVSGPFCNALNGEMFLIFLSGRKEKINCAYSNEAFELWYLLHFELYENAMSRRNYSELLTSHIGEDYQKNSKDMLRILARLGDESLAIRRAERLSHSYNGSNPANENPVTYVHRLINSLREQLIE